MKSIITILSFILICCNTQIVFAQNITVDDTKTVTDLVKILTNNSSCVTVLNPTATGDTYTTGQNSYGYFNSAGGSFPFTEGIVLSTGSSKNVIKEGTLNQDVSLGSQLWLGDPDLDKALGINSTNFSYNATSLEFDFTVLSNFISFRYFFASNEYRENFPCLYSDGFAFLIKEKNTATNYENIALIPESTTVVSSTTIHPLINDFKDSFGNTVKGCEPKNPTFYEDPIKLTNSQLNFNGQTIFLTAQKAVIPGITYHIKLVISDSGSQRFDSAVFLEAGSFTPKIDLGANQFICFGENYTINSGLSKSLGYGYKWYKDGSITPIIGENNPTLLVNIPGDYSVLVDIGSGCTATGTVKIEYYSKINLTDTTLKNCVNNTSNQANFDLTKADSIIKNGVLNLSPVRYFETLDTKTNTLSNLIIIPSNYTYTRTASTKIVYGEVTNSNGCSSFAKITLDPTFYTNPVSTVFLGTIVTDFDGSGNTISINYPGNTNEYKLVDSISMETIYDFQSNATFTNIYPGIYTVYVRDISSCNQVVNSNSIYVLDYQRFFTPNGDGFNDVWEIENLQLFPKANISIFDRYGKLLQQLNSASSGWNGTLNGHELLASDYWFRLDFGDGKIIKGHFALKR